MQNRDNRRSNEEWIAAFQGSLPDSSEASLELSQYLQACLSRMLGRKLCRDDIAEITQEALAQIVKSLASFRGDSAFTTWAIGVATRVAFTELRRRQAQESHHRAFEELMLGELDTGEEHALAPGQELDQSELHDALHAAINSELTRRQRIAVLAELREIPTVEISGQLGITQNALYKLTHDARKRLRASLLLSGFSTDEIHLGARGVHR